MQTFSSVCLSCKAVKWPSEASCPLGLTWVAPGRQEREEQARRTQLANFTMSMARAGHEQEKTLAIENKERMEHT